MSLPLSLLALLAVSPARAGYGDASGGLPTHAEREVHFWTNAVRVDPAAFADAYDCSFGSFSNSESTPTWPLYWNEGLGEAANYHSVDMDTDGYFDHDSNDGTSWADRIYAFYSGWGIGENIAWGYTSSYSAVIEGWMCSGGHRANIMSDNFNELGTGVSGSYYTQDFGTGSPPMRAIAMGIHLPANPSGTVQFGADWALEPGPDELFVVLDGQRIDMSLYVGDANGWGAWAVEASIGGGCHEYYFVGRAQGLEQTFPEHGSYGFGSCAFDDPGAGWIDGQLPYEASTTPTTPSPTDPGSTVPATDDESPSDDDDDDDRDEDDDDDDDTTTDEEADLVTQPAGGCQVSATPTGAVGLLLAVFAVYRRRR